MVAIVAFLTFVVLVLVGYAVSSWIIERYERKRAIVVRLERVTGGAATTAAPESNPSSLLRDERLSQIALLDTFLGRLTFVGKLVRMIQQSGIRKRPGEVLLYVPLLGGIGFVVITLIGGGQMMGLAVGGIAACTPLFVVSRIRRQRANKFGEQLPEALDLIRAALQAGHGFVSALGVVANEFPDPIAQEFHRVAEEIRLGLPVRDALYNLVNRIDDPNLPILVIGVLVAQNVGGNLAEVVDNISYTIRERFKLLREIKVMTAQGRLSGGVLSTLPFAVAGLMQMLNPAYFAPMFHTPTGHYLIAYSLGSVFMGHLIIRRLVSIRV